MRVAGRLAGEVLDFIAPHVRPGITTGELDSLCHDYMVKVQKTVPGAAQLCAAGLPALSQIHLHLDQPPGLPRHSGRKKLKHGDIVNIDITVIKDGWHGDTSRMYYVGEAVRSRRAVCVEITYECMWLGISPSKPGAHLGDIGNAIQNHAESKATAWCANTAATASAGSSTRSRKCCITAAPATASSCSRA